GRHADRTADEADHAAENRADAGITPTLIANRHLALKVLRDDRVRFDALARGLLRRLHRLEHLARGVLAVVDGIDERFRLVRRTEHGAEAAGAESGDDRRCHAASD